MCPFLDPVVILDVYYDNNCDIDAVMSCLFPHSEDQKSTSSRAQSHFDSKRHLDFAQRLKLQELSRSFPEAGEELILSVMHTFEGNFRKSAESLKTIFPQTTIVEVQQVAPRSRRQFSGLLSPVASVLKFNSAQLALERLYEGIHCDELDDMDSLRDEHAGVIQEQANHNRRHVEAIASGQPAHVAIIREDARAFANDVKEAREMLVVAILQK